MSLKRLSQLKVLLTDFPHVLNQKITYELGDPDEAYIKGEVILADGSKLALAEFLEKSKKGWKIERYRYHLMNKNNELIFRYDNAPHHPKIKTFPHHKHLSEIVTLSQRPSFKKLMDEALKIYLTRLEKKRRYRSSGN